MALLAYAYQAGRCDRYSDLEHVAQWFMSATSKDLNDVFDPEIDRLMKRAHSVLCFGSPS